MYVQVEDLNIKLTASSMVVFYLPYHHDDDNNNDDGRKIRHDKEWSEGSLSIFRRIAEEYGREIVYGTTRGRETVYSSKETRM